MGLVFTGNATLLGSQLIGAASLIMVSFLLSISFFYPLKKLGRLRISKI